MGCPEFRRKAEKGGVFSGGWGAVGSYRPASHGRVCQVSPANTNTLVLHFYTARNALQIQNTEQVHQENECDLKNQTWELHTETWEKQDPFNNICRMLDDFMYKVCISNRFLFHPPPSILTLTGIMGWNNIQSCSPFISKAVLTKNYGYITEMLRILIGQ